MLKALSTKRLTLRALRLDDAESMFSYAGDPQNTRFMSWPAHKTLQDTKDYLDFIMTRYSQGGHYDWAIQLKDGEMIGTCGFLNVEPGDKAEIGYILHKKYWGRGYAPEAIEALLRFAFGELKLETIYAQIHRNNEASIRAASKLGFTPDADYLLINNIEIKDACRGAEIYTLNKDKFLNGNH